MLEGITLILKRESRLPTPAWERCVKKWWFAGFGVFLAIAACVGLWPAEVRVRSLDPRLQIYEARMWHIESSLARTITNTNV
jgi:hypothetical protein